jgi:methyltransferase family protein
MIFARYKLERLSELLAEPWGDLRIPGLLALINQIGPMRVLEIGSFKGVSTELFLLHAAHVTTIDPWEDRNIFSQFHSRCSTYPNLTYVQGYSPAAVPPGIYDFAYIDGDHSYQAVLADIEICLSVMGKNGQWIGGHDYDGVDTPDVARAVKKVFPNHEPTIFPDSSWLVRL